MIDLHNPEYIFYKNLFYDLIDSYAISIKKEYQFVYDDLLEHLILDCIEYVKKNHDILNRNNKIIAFKAKFHQHISSREWYDKIYKTEECPEVIRQLREKKLNNILTKI